MHEFPDGVTQIGQGAFKGCSSLKAVSISDEVNYIGSEAFVYTGIYYEAWGEDPVYLSNHLIYVQQGTEGELKIKEGTKTIASNAVKNRGGITSVTIPQSLVAIGEDAFSECYYIRQINYGGTREEWE